MRFIETNRVPLILAGWMIALPLVLAFLAGAGAGTFFNGLATFAGTLWSIYGGSSLMVGIILVLWVLWTTWRSRRVHG